MITNKQLFKKFEDYIQAKNYSASTLESYTKIIEKLFFLYQEKQIEDLTTDEIKKFIFSGKTVNTQITYYRPTYILFYYILKQKDKFKGFLAPSREFKDKEFIEQSILIRSLKNIDSTRDEAILTVLYSLGLRPFELFNLKLIDIDFNKKTFAIRDKRDINRINRVLPMTDYVHTLLTKYIRIHTPNEYLFNGMITHQYNLRTLQCIVKKHLGDNCSPTIVRNSTAVTMYKNGNSFNLIKNHLGLKSVANTEMFLKQLISIEEVRLPI